MATVDEPRSPSEGRERLSAPRFGGSAIQTALNLGPLASLPGSWKGKGFSVMWRPQNFTAEVNDPPLAAGANPIRRYLMLNKTSESFDFQVIPGQVPNRGLQQGQNGTPQAQPGTPQEDIFLYGLHYLQRVSDDDKKGFLDAGQALHLEPGLFMYVPPNDNSGVTGYSSTEATIVRMGSIPHGVNVLMQGTAPGATPVPGPPVIPDTYPIPSMPVIPNPPGPTAPAGGGNIVGLGIQPFTSDPPNPLPPSPPNPPFNPEHIVPEVRVSNDVLPTPAAAGGPVQSNGPYPHDFQRIIDNPNSVLQDHIAHQEILGSITIEMSTEAVTPGVSQIPFLGVAENNGISYLASTQNNCYVLSAAATFWLEWVKAPGEPRRYHNHHLFGMHRGDGRVGALDPFLGEPTYLQLQYSQMVILVFNQVFWPHITVATMHLSNG